MFDKRVAVNPGLQETEAGLCYACQAVLSPADQEHPQYQPPRCCPHCFQSEEARMALQTARRTEAIRRITDPLPGSIPYDNIRPLNVPQRFDQRPLIELLSSLHGHVARDYWESECRAGRFRLQGQPLQENTLVRAGWRIEHLFPQTVEPDVNAAMTVLYEDEALVAVDKPAPLPMHPCGRFNRNSLIAILDQVYAPHCLRMLHRLDANTTGIVVLARTREFSRQIHPQFAAGTVRKRYLALVRGEPKSSEFECDLKISREVTRAGGRFADPESGLSCLTRFRSLGTHQGQTLISCEPLTGRTNQIRLHLASMGLPIVGDPVYRQSEDVARFAEAEGDDPTQTLPVGSEPMCLHSLELTLEHPLSRRPLTLRAPLPNWAQANWAQARTEG